MTRTEAFRRGLCPQPARAQRAGGWLLCGLFAAACASRPPVASEKKPSAPSLDAAETLFAAGEFHRADELYSRILSENPSERKALERHGTIALYSNRLLEAKSGLRRSIELDPGDPKIRGLLAEAYYRSDEFADAAKLFRSIGREAMASKLESFKDKVPYHFIGEETAVKFVQTDPLPVVAARLNGGEPGLFIVDTGGSELIVDTEAAQRAGVKLLGSETATYAGDLKGSYQHGALAQLQLGPLTVRNIPVHVRDTRAFSAVAGGKHIDGILGTVFLYHFLATLDYPQGELILRKPTAHTQADSREERSGDRVLAVPFWMSGDHIMVAWGTLNGGKPLLWFIDTGLAGHAFTCPESTLRAAGIDLPEGPAREGTGGGGRVRAQPFRIDRLTLGQAEATNLSGLLGPFPASLEMGQGYRISGLISHAFFRGFRCTFDFGKMRLILASRSRASP